MMFNMFKSNHAKVPMDFSVALVPLPYDIHRREFMTLMTINGFPAI